MSTVPEWVGPYVGLPYKDKGRGPDAWDCWGGVRMVYAEVFGLALPDYSEAYSAAKDHASVAAAVAVGLADGWAPVEKPQVGDLLILKIAQRPWHCALMVTSDKFLHWPPPDRRGVQMLSCWERLDSPQWAKRIEGFYRSTMAAPN